MGEEIDEGGDPPRIWSPDGDYPGTAFTRSIGDSVAEVLGVTAEPEMIERIIQPNDCFGVIASDGVFEFLTNQMVADLIFSNSDINKGCREVVEQAYELWLQYEVRTDDITIIALHFKDPDKMRAVSMASDGTSMASFSLNNSIELSNYVPGGRSSSMEESRPVRRVMGREKRNTVILQRDSLHHQGESYQSTNPIGSSLDDFEDQDDTQWKLSGTVVPKSSQEKTMLSTALKKNFLFQNMESTQLDTVISLMQKQVTKPNEVIIKQGDSGDKFFVVETGSYEVRVNVADTADNDRNSALSDITSHAADSDTMLGTMAVHTYQASKDRHPCFGELALL